MLLLISQHLAGQQSEFRIGFTASTGLAWMTTNDRSISSVGSNLTASIGATGEFRILEKMVITTGLGLGFNRGGTLRHAIGGNFFPNSRLSSDAYNTGAKPLPDGTRLKYNIQYLEFPLGLKWRFGNPERIGYYAELPVITWDLAIQRRGSIKAGEIGTAKENISRDVAAMNIMWGLGGGIEMPVSDGKTVTAGLTFSRGFNDITGNQAKTAIPNPDDNPFDPNDDYLLRPEHSHALMNVLVVRVGILF